MATIVKRGKKYSVVYNYTDENGVQRQKWEPPVATKKEAKQRLAEVEYEIQKGTFIVPTCRKVSDFLAEFVEVYGTKKWGLSMYAANTGLIRNYINPILGDVLVQDVDTRAVDRFITRLQRTKAVTVNGHRPKSEYVTPCTILKINKLMSTAFKQAVRWGMIGKNPFDGAVLPHHEEQRRAIWNEETIRRALDACEDGKLFMAIHLAFACSLRFGEICGLTWDCVDISDAAIMNGDAYLHVKKVLARVDAEAIDVVGKQDILFTFPAVVSGKAKTRLVLKKPKTESSIRKIWIPETLAKLLREWKANQERLKELLGDEYSDYNLVIALDNGRPCEDRVLGNAFNRLKKNAGLPNVVFHSLRHSSTTYKLKQNHGDIKATQGDTGHAQPDMVTRVYSHILDEDRKVNAQRFEAAFYANPDMREQERQLRAQSPQQQPQDVLELAKLLSENPALATLLAGILKNGTA